MMIILYLVPKFFLWHRVFSEGRETVEMALGLGDQFPQDWRLTLKLRRLASVFDL